MIKIKVKEVSRDEIPMNYYIVKSNYYYKCKYKNLKFYIGTMIAHNNEDINTKKSFIEIFVSEYNMVKDLINNNIYETAEAIQNYYHDEFGMFIKFSDSLNIAKLYMKKKETINALSCLFE